METLTIDFVDTNQDICTLQMYNLLGTIVFEKIIDSMATTTVDLPPLSIGTYFLTLMNEKKDIIKRTKIVIE